MGEPWHIQDLADSVVGRPGPRRAIVDEADLRAELDRLRDLEPRVVALQMGPDECLYMGIGGPVAYVEYVADEPYGAATAVPRQPYTDPDGLGDVSFRCGRTGSEIDEEWIMPAADAIDIVLWVFRHADLPDWVEWRPS